MTPSARLTQVLQAILPGDTGGLALFDRIAGAPGPSPDFLEWSAHLSGGCEGARLTYYFDVGPGKEATARAAGARFGALAEALRLPLPPPLLPRFFAAVPGAPEIRQVVLGLDDRGGAVRGKLYHVLQGSAAPLLGGLLEAAGAPLPPHGELERVYILGLDVGAAGLLDAKLYYRLDVGRLHRVVGNLAALGALRAATREVVLQRCLLSARSQLYFHADNPRSIARFLAARSGSDEAAARLLRWHQAACSGLHQARLEPWILSFAYRQHHLDSSVGNVYFHLLEG